MMYFASKGLFIKEIDDDLYVIQDVFGTSSLPFQSSKEELDEKTNTIAKTHKLVTVRLDSEFPDFSDFRWDELEYFYISHIDYAFLASLINGKEIERYHSVMGLFPIGYLDCGYGDGSKYALELVHSKFKQLCKDKNFPVQERDLELFLVTNQVKRICSDIMSLMNRSISAYTELLRCHRRCIATSYKAIEQLNSKEIIHHGNDSYHAATAVTSLVISVCSSLDLSAKLLQYINSINPADISFKAARDRQYHEIKKIRPNFISDQVLTKIAGYQNSNSDIPEIIQFRNDLIHSTSAIELEKIYVGIETDEVNDMPLYYSAQYARDCLTTGQPVRHLGRDYFVEGKVDIEVKTLNWVHKAIEYHINVAKEVHSCLLDLKKPDKPNHSDTDSDAGV
jgi:hypothetical protein